MQKKKKRKRKPRVLRSSTLIRKNWIKSSAFGPETLIISFGMNIMNSIRASPISGKTTWQSNTSL